MSAMALVISTKYFFLFSMKSGISCVSDLTETDFIVLSNFETRNDSFHLPRRLPEPSGIDDCCTRMKLEPEIGIDATLRVVRRSAFGMN